MTLDDALPEREASVLAALLRLEQGGGRPTIRVVADGAGLAVSSAYDALASLSRRGLVAWEEQLTGTLRSSVEIHAPTKRPRIIRTRRIGRRW